jgi:hypothetical protein
MNLFSSSRGCDFPPLTMAVLMETSLGDLEVDLFTAECPRGMQDTHRERERERERESVRMCV